MQVLVEVAIRDELVNKQGQLSLEAEPQELHNISVVDLGENDNFVDEVFHVALESEFLDGHDLTVGEHALVDGALASLSEDSILVEAVGGLFKVP